MINKIRNFIVSHKIISIIILIIVIIVVYFIVSQNKNTETRYITELVRIGNIETSVTGTGQVEASDTLTLKSKNTGDITSVNVKIGQEVKKGALIASVDSRDAKIALENAEISLAKLIAPDELSLLQKENSLDKSYNDGWNNVSNFVVNATSLIDEIESIYSNDGFLGSKNLNGISVDRNIVMLAEDSLYKANKSFDNLVKKYKSLSRLSSDDEIKNIISDAYESAILINDVSKKTENAFSFVVSNMTSADASIVSSNRSNISSWINTTNSYVNNLFSSQNSISEGIISLSDEVSGADILDIRSAELSVQNKKDAYNDCFIRAPFDGVIATLTAKVGESSGSSIGTLITKEKIVTVPFNEIDIASIKIGQRAILSVDAIPDLMIEGSVIEIDPVGTVNSGVVTYNVKIILVGDNENLKPGMSVSVEIITNYNRDVLVVSNNSIKTKNGISTVNVFDVPLANSTNSTGATSSVLPVSKEVIIGLSDDSLTEIAFGLNEGDQIVTKTIQGTVNTSSSSSSAPSILSSMGAGTGTGGGSRMRIPHN